MGTPYVGVKMGTEVSRPIALVSFLSMAFSNSVASLLSVRSGLTLAHRATHSLDSSSTTMGTGEVGVGSTGLVGG